MNLKRKIKTYYKTREYSLVTIIFYFHPNRFERIGALYKALGHEINTNMCWLVVIWHSLITLMRKIEMSYKSELLSIS
jgi:hypothetical protein